MTGATDGGTTEAELLALARRGVARYFGGRRRLSADLARRGYAAEWFLWPAYRRAKAAPPGYEVWAAARGCADEARLILGRGGQSRFEAGLYVGDPDPTGFGYVAPDRWHPPARAARPTPLQSWCHYAPVRARCRWSWRDRLLVYLVCVEGWLHREAGAALGVSGSLVTLVVGGVGPRLTPYGIVRHQEADAVSPEQERQRAAWREKKRRQKAKALSRGATDGAVPL